MKQRRLTNSAVTVLGLALGSWFLAGPLAAQTAEEVKSDVLSALSTPLPITVIGPLLTRDVEVVADGEGFFARLEDTSLMGIFPFGEVSMKLVPIGADTYRITDLQFPQSLDFPGIGSVVLGSTEIDGIWSAKSRSYSELHWAIRDAEFAPGQGGAGRLALGGIAFDVVKEPNEDDTNSRIAITADSISARELTPEDIDIGSVRAVLTANGEKPVDLYSLLREVIMRSGMRDGGSSLRSLGASLLGNTYGVVSLELAGTDLLIADSMRPQTRFFRAGGLEASARLTDVAPRDWGAADVSLRFVSVDQTDMIDAGALALDSAELSVRGRALPVADMLEALRLLSDPWPRGPISATAILDGLAAFGRLEIATEGAGLSAKVVESRRPDVSAETDAPKEPRTVFETAFDKWALRFGLAGLDRNEGTLYLGADVSGGRFVPGEAFPRDSIRHVRAWFPETLRAQSDISNLNEGLLKKLLADVTIANRDEPVELILPLGLYAAATVLEATTRDGVYETDLFRFEQSSRYRLYPTEFLSLFPYEGESDLKLTGLDGLLGYLEEIRREARPGSDEAAGLGAVKTGLIVLRNLAREDVDGALSWEIARPDIRRAEIRINGTTFRYPEITRLLPLVLGAALRL